MKMMRIMRMRMSSRFIDTFWFKFSIFNVYYMYEIFSLYINDNNTGANKSLNNYQAFVRVHRKGQGVNRGVEVVYRGNQNPDKLESSSGVVKCDVDMVASEVHGQQEEKKVKKKNTMVTHP